MHCILEFVWLCIGLWVDIDISGVQVLLQYGLDEVLPATMSGRFSVVLACWYAERPALRSPASDLRTEPVNKTIAWK